MNAVLKRRLRWALPFTVSTIFIVYVLSGMEMEKIAEGFTPRVAWIFIPGLLVFLFATLFIEAVCLVVVIHDDGGETSLSKAAQMKAASYLLGLLNYAVGAGALTFLLRRRAQLSLADSAGVVLLISLFDLLSVLAMASFGLMALGTEGPGVQIAWIVAGVGLIVLGFAVLRLPRPLGPLDHLRDLQIFRAARTASIGCLVKVGLLRLSFIITFMGLAATAMMAFEVWVPIFELVVKVTVLLLIAAVPITVAGLGTSQLAFIELFGAYASRETLMAASLTLSFGLIVSRAAMGLVFARQYTTEAFAAAREPGGDDMDPKSGEAGSSHPGTTAETRR